MNIFEETAQRLTGAVEGMAGTMEKGMEKGKEMMKSGMKEGKEMMKSGMKEGEEMMKSGMKEGEEMMGEGKMMYGGKRHMKSKSHKKAHHEKNVGSRAEVFHGTAAQTSGGLMKKDLKKNKYGRIVSKKASKSAKKNFAKNLPKSVRAKPFKKGHKTRRRSRK